MHCAKAHGENDRRHAVYEQDENHTHTNNAGSNGGERHRGSGGGGGSRSSHNSRWNESDYFEFVCREDQQERERAYYMFVYKTRKCEGFPFNCNCDGLDYHREEERRRGPEIRYAPMACPNVKPYLNAEWGNPVVDCSGKFAAVNAEAGAVVQWDCEYAHTLLELMYHPAVYKTGLCDHFDVADPLTWKCVWKRRCAHAHGEVDTRAKDRANDEWKEHLRLLPPINHNTALPLAHTLQPATATVSITSVSSTSPATLEPTTLWPTDANSTTTSPPISGERERRLSLFDVSSQQSVWAPLASQTKTLSSPKVESWEQTRRASISVVPLAAKSETEELAPSSPARSPSPSLLPSELLDASETEGGNIISVNERLTYDQSQILSTGHDTYKLYAGLMDNVHHVGIKLISKNGADESAYRTIRDQIDHYLQMSDTSFSSATRYLQVVEEEDNIIIAVELYPSDLPLHEALPRALVINSAHFQPVALIHQLFQALSVLHAADVVHGDISPYTITVDLAYSHLRLGDVTHKTTKMTSADDVYAAGTLTYWLLSQGRSPFSDAEHEQTEWNQRTLKQPFDTALLTPISSHFLLYILFTDVDKRMTAKQCLCHPLFWSLEQSMRFICAVDTFIRQHREADDSENSIISENVMDFIDSVEQLLNNILPNGDHLDWSQTVYQAFHHRHIEGKGDYDSRSVLSLIRFIHDFVEHLTRSPLVSCHIHTLFHLPHLANCTKPQRPHQQHKHISEKCILESVASYFLPRFPSLLISLYHHVATRWSQHDAFAEFFTQQPLAIINQDNRNLQSTQSQADYSIIEDLRTALLCPIQHPQPHPLNEPVVTPCCSRLICHSCIPAYMKAAEERAQQNHVETETVPQQHNHATKKATIVTAEKLSDESGAESFINEPSVAASASYTCECGRQLTRVERDKMTLTHHIESVQTIIATLKRMK